MEKVGGNFSTSNSSLAKPPPLYAGGLQPLDSGEWSLVIPGVLVAICLSGIAGNLCVIGILLHNGRRAKPSLIHSLILNVCVSDLLLLTLSAPFKAAAYSRTPLSFGWLLCKTADWFSHACMSSKSMSIACVSKACFMYASNPAKQVNIKQQTVCAVLLSSWLLSALLPLPEWIFTGTKQIDGSPACIMDVPPHAQEMMAIFVKFYPFLVYCIPFTLAFFYFWRAYGHCQRRGTKTQNLRNQIRSRRLTIMLISLTVTFAILWLPEWVSWLWVWHQTPSGPSPPQAFKVLAQILMFSLSSINPLIFLVMSDEFKESFKDIWKHLASRKSVVAPGIQEKATAPSDIPPESSPSPKHSTGGLEEQSCSQQNFGSQESKDNPVLPDVEQFWNERETHLTDQDNDPVPWEHQEEQPVGSGNPSSTN
ncbi:G-protein coupled receptor 151 [Xenopus laevis]|uniref:GPCR-2037 n=2 Tax=Xenopus laevis TaxID=8355 RepID=A0A974DCP9_XENLA|nr:G-protein coupled receptor 151 [Xenopus laevis]OCT88586.1 hypothetical protein XELAEV_18017215mg [Xenopus laevis]